MGRKLEDAVEDKGTTLKKDVSPIPAVIFDNMVRFGLDPQVEGNKGKTADPSVHTVSMDTDIYASDPHRIICVAKDRPSGTRKHAKANMQYATKSLPDGVQGQKLCHRSKISLKLHTSKE